MYKRQDRIWLANYPAGVTIRNNRYQSYEWFRHSPGNSRSLVNDQVHDVIEDSEGDLWFATSNGISLLQPAVGRWRSFLSRSDGIQAVSYTHLWYEAHLKAPLW